MHLARRFAFAVAVGVGGASLASCGSTAPDDATSIVASVAIDPPSSTLVVGAATALTAVVRDANGQAMSGVSIVWSVQNASVAMISASGIVTARAEGGTQVAASVNGVSAVASITVRLPPVASVLVEPDTRPLQVGQTATFTATTRSANGVALPGRAVAWTSSNTAVASVAPTGVVTANGVGTATITATSEGVSGSATVTVSPVPVGSVAIAPSSATVTVGHTAPLIATVKDANGTTVTDRVVAWSSSDERVATVSAAGVVRGIAPGSAVISATSEGHSATTSVTVTPIPVAAIALQPTSLTIVPGQTAALTATTTTADGTVVTGRTITYASDNTGVARVSSTGVVTGVALGSAVITATSEGRSTTATVTVQPAVASVLVSPGLVLLRKGSTVQLSAAAYDASGTRIFGRAVTWSSSDKSVATVDANGVVTTVKAGVVQITATIDGKSDSSLITVTN